VLEDARLRALAQRRAASEAAWARPGRSAKTARLGLKLSSLRGRRSPPTDSSEPFRPPAVQALASVQRRSPSAATREL
jgi:hypothetical protein